MPWEEGPGLWGAGPRGAREVAQRLGREGLRSDASTASPVGTSY